MLGPISERLAQRSHHRSDGHGGAIWRSSGRASSIAKSPEIAGRRFQRSGRLARASAGISRAGSGPWRDLTSILGLSRLLAKMGDTRARELTALFGTYGELCGLTSARLVLLGDRALPALIEMRRAESKEQRVWALKILRRWAKPSRAKRCRPATTRSRSPPRLRTRQGRRCRATSFSRSRAAIGVKSAKPRARR